jgi:hypothetical protein
LHAFSASFLVKAELLIDKEVLDAVAGLKTVPGEMVLLDYGEYGG